MQDIPERIPSPPSLLIAAHCSTIRRKSKRLDNKELSAILDDFSRELNTTNLHPLTYLNSLNQIVKILNSYSPSVLPNLSSHYFFLLIRNTIKNLLQKLSQFKRLDDQEVYLLRNCCLLINHLIKNLPDVSKVLHWITDVTFLDALAECLNRIDKISKKDNNRHAIKQLTRLLNIFCIIQERLPLNLHRTLFVRLLQPTINCLTSLNYVKLFENFQSNADSLTENQKLFLIKCPYFLTTYNGPRIEKVMEQVLDVMLPRYVAILDKHIQTIQQWKRPIMRAIHNLIITIVYAEGYFHSYTYTESFRSLINHLLTILNESTLIKKIHPNSNNIETLLIDATLIVFNVLVYESNALDYIKQQKSSTIFRQLTKTSYEKIVLNAYMMLAYTIDDNDLKTSSDDLIQLFSTTFNLLEKTMANMNRENIDRSILQLLETLKGLVQYEQIRNEIFKQGLLTFFIDSYSKLQGLSKQILLECIWKLSFDESIAQQLREYTQFIFSLENLLKSTNENIPSNVLRRSTSFSSLRNNAGTIFMEADNYGMQKAANGLLWKVMKEPQFREKMKNSNDQHKYKYDIMISYSYADKDIVHKIQQFLANEGYTIWSEHNHNNEQAMQIVAEAIENSEFIIICMSDSYKRDNHCQAQAEYALSTKRILFPLIVHSGYKSDGWLNALIHNQIPIDFGISNFKTASELLLKEIKQRQHKKDIPNGKETISSSANIDRQQSTATHSISRSLTPVADTSVRSTVTDRQQQGSVSSTLQPPTPPAIYTVAPITVFRQQQQVPIQPASTPLASDSIHTNASIAADKQQQPTASMQPVSRSTTPGVTSFNTSTTIIQQQPLLQSVSRLLTSGSTASIASSIGDKQQQQQQNSVRSISRSTTANPIYSIAPIVVNQQQQQQTSIHSISRSSTANPIYSIAPIVINQQYQQQQQMVLHPVERSSTPSSVSSDPSVTTGTQRRQTPAHTVSESFTPNNGAPIASTTIDQQPQTLIRPVSPPPTPGSNVSVASVARLSIRKSASTTTIDVDKRQKQTETPTPNSTSFNGSQFDGKQPQQKVPVLSIPQIPTTNTVLPATSSVTTQRQHQTSVQSNSIPSSVSTIDDKQQRQTSVHSTPKSLIPVSADIGKRQRQSSHSNSRPTTPGSGVHTTYVNIEKQQLPSRSNSKSTMPVTSIGIEKQQQRLPSQLNSRSATPAAWPNNSSNTSLGRLTSLQLNAQEQLRLPAEYTNRKTHNSIYRTLSINNWRNNDVLDFLFDTHLYTMMPLCESMSGRALIRLFRMCHRKPTRLYDQLNEELRIRFKGLTLPMGVYTQFLIEMDALVGPVSDTISPMPDPHPKIVERVIFMARPTEQRQPIPRSSTVSSNHSKTATPVESMSGTTTSHNLRFVERAIYRPASNIARPYNFIIESVEESTALLDQVQRYGNQLLFLDETAQQNREINNHRSN